MALVVGEKRSMHFNEKTDKRKTPKWRKKRTTIILMEVNANKSLGMWNKVKERNQI